jgi:hypothetical protein
MSGTSPALNYTIYTPGSTTVPWTSLNDQTVTLNGAASATVNFNASITLGQNDKAGSYTDGTTTFRFTYTGTGSFTTDTRNAGTAATVGAECSFSVPTGTVAFGVYNPSAVADNTTTFQATYTCDEDGTSYKWGFASAHASGTQMRMLSGALFLNYYVHDSSTANFGSGAAAQTAASEGSLTAFSNQNYTFTFGITKLQNPGTGAFSDTNVVTLTP